MQLLIVTGLSGAGKSSAVRVLEDLEFFCIDNMPPNLIPDFVSLVQKSSDDNQKFAIVVDARAGKAFSQLFDSLNTIKSRGIDYKIIFLDAENSVLLKRYKETRRKHPLAEKYKSSTNEAIDAERLILSPIKDMADYIVDTSNTDLQTLRQRIKALFYADVSKTLKITCLSFGFKYGIPADADIVFDVRCLPNPFYVSDLKNKTGMDQEVVDFIWQFDQSKQLYQKIQDLIDFSIPLYQKEGKSGLVIAFGCTGGKHRSVYFARKLCKHLQDNDYVCTLINRDILK
ncbi:MAG: RNase adapter RapZ [Clostridia bacterium]|nr:RNase adapter RapZ [Clostridia bacterium]